MLNEQAANIVQNRQQTPSDTIPPQGRVDVSLEETALSNYILNLFRNDIRDKEDYGWIDKRTWDLSSYYQTKNPAMQNYPWKGASAFRVPITPALVDTGHANIKASIFSSQGDPIKVFGIGVEDDRKAPYLENLLNWQVTNEANVEREMDVNIFRSFLHGTGVMKVMRTDLQNSIKVVSLDVENVYLPIDSKGMQKEDCDHIFQIIPLTQVDIQYRKALGVYKDLDKLQPGMNILNGSSKDSLMIVKDRALGTDMSGHIRRDMFYMMEAHLTYFPPNSMRPLELIVWISPNGGTIHRMMINPDGIRPFSEYKPYPQPDRFFGVSLPEKIRSIQEEADYADKQNTDALDKAISPAGFIDDTSGFDPSWSMRVPNGIYPTGKAGSPISFEPQPPMERGFERRMQDLWGQAERLTGIIDVAQGASTKSGRTLGETEIRISRSDIRFRTIFDRFESGWKKTIDIIYQLDNKYMPRDKKIKIIGYSDLKTVDEIFPSDAGIDMGLGIEGKFDFRFSGKAVSDVEQEKMDTVQFYQLMAPNPLVATNKANLWRLSQKLADVLGQRNFEQLVSTPKEVNIYSVQEFLERVMSGQFDVTVRPGIDTAQYMFELQLFMKTDMFKGMNPRGQQTIVNALQKAQIMAQAEQLAAIDNAIVQRGQQQPIQQMQPNMMQQQGGVDVNQMIPSGMQNG